MQKLYPLLTLFALVGTLNLGAQNLIEIPISVATDDLEERLTGNSAGAPGSIDATSSDLELGSEAADGSGPQLVGLRFAGIPIEPGTQILNAYIQFTVDEDKGSSAPATFTIRVEDAADAAPLDAGTPFDISSRTTLGTTVTWNSAAGTWDFPGDAGPDQQTANLVDLVQAIVDRDGWAAGNAMVFTIEGTGTRTAESFEGDSEAVATLVVEVPAPTSVGLQGCTDPTLAGNREFELSVLSTYSTGVFDEGAAEIVSYDAGSQRLFFSNADANTVTILDISNPAMPAKVGDIDLSMLGGGINSVAVFDGIVATSLEADAVDGDGMVGFYDVDGNLLGSVTVGVLPDMITFSPDGTKVLTANEGEPSDDYLTDPEGSVSIIDISGGVASATVTNVTFEGYNDQKVSLQNKGIRIFGPNATVAQDLEPEYIAIAEDTLAYVAMQENNAFAVININTGEILDLLPLGYKDHSDGRPVLNEYVLNELIDLPELGTPTYGGGQPPVFLGGFSGLYFDPTESTDELYVFYAIPDRGPNDAAVNRNDVTPASPTNLRPFKLPDYQGRVAKFILDITDGEVILDDQIFLTRADGTTPISGRGNIPGFDETPVVPADPGLTGTGDLFSDDFEDEMLELGNWTSFSVASNADWFYDSFQDDNFAEINGFGADEASDDWLISPGFMITTGEPIYISFSTARNFSGGDFRVLLNDGDYSGSGDPASGTWSDVTDQFVLSEGGFAEVFSGEREFTAPYTGTTYLAFRYTTTGTGGGDGALWQLDDVNISTTPLAAGDFTDSEGNVYTALPFDEFGGDFESVLRDPNGDFWMCDEYRPAIYHFSATGTLIDRFVPIGTSLLGTTPQPAGTYGTETLPAVYAKRRANRGFEGMALNTDDGLLYAFIQSPIENPDNSVRNNSDVIRVLAVNPADGTPVAEYVYLLESNANRGFDVGRVDKIGDVVYAGNGKFLVLERDSSVPGQDEGKKFIFEITLTGATNILNDPIATEDGSTGMTLEQMSADEIVAAGVTPINKVKVLNLPSIGYLPSDKPEGIAALPNGAIAVLNDNDFGLAGAGVSDNSTLGIIEFCTDNSLDPSNRDDAIAIQNVPTLGMYMPDAIASFSRGGRSYIVTANEGDSRDYDGYSEEERIADVTLDPTAFPDAATLQQDENLGRLLITTSQGDLDGDGDFDQLYSYGARSFSIFDRYGNLVFDSGNEFERIIAEQLPADFNSNNDENDSFDARSDDKGPEPEAVTIVEKNDTVYALIGLERVGGIMVYNITDPTAPYFVNYVNNRDFSVDAQLPDDSVNPEVGDLGVEDIVYIDAADSPTGQPLVVTANEISGTVTIFGAEFNKPGFRLRIVHNNDGESRIVPDTIQSMVIGGAAQFKAVVDDLRSDGLPTVTLSSGDNFLPGPAFNASLNRAEGLPFYDAVIVDEIGYDALAIGNHDFDAGPDVLAEFIEDVSNTQPPYLSANLDFSQEPNLQALVDIGRIAPRTIVERDGVRIGVIGLTTDLLPTISSPRNVTVDDMLALVVQEQVMMLQAEGVDNIILISHLQALANELELIEQISGVDVVIAGGGDELLTNNPDNAIPGVNVDGAYPLKQVDAAGDTVLVVTTPGNYRYVGNLVVEFDEEGEIFRVDAESDVILVKDVAPDPFIQSMVTDSILAYTDDLQNNIIAITEVDLDGSREKVRTEETNQGNLIADAFLWLGNREAGNFDLDPTLPIIAVQNGGGIRNDEIIPAFSELSELTTFDMLPFSNFVTVINPISTDTLKAVLENAVSNVANVDGRFLQIAGFSFIWDTTGVADENRIFRATLDDGTVLIDDYQVVTDTMLYVVTNSFTASGGDSFFEFASAGVFANVGPSYQRALFEYLLAEDGVNGVVTAEQYPVGGEGRIQKLQEVATDELNLADYDFGVSPNPFPGAFNVSYQLPERSEVELVLFDLTGRQVFRQPARVQGAGTYRMRFTPQRNLPQGIYLLRVRIDDRVGAVRLVKQ
jgi:2',3'-cyclic-nucleotide 2'-phosphodiesterase (5'-nucleotidase family)